MKQRVLTLAVVVLCFVGTAVRGGAAGNSAVQDWSKDFRLMFVSQDSVTSARTNKTWTTIMVDRKGKPISSKSVTLSGNSDFQEIARVIPWYSDVKIVLIKEFEIRARPPWYENTFEDVAIRAEFLKVTLDPGDVLLVFPRKEF